MKQKNAILKELQTIPGIGKSISNDLYEIGIRSVSDLEKCNPEKLFDKSNKYINITQDRCLLYTFRCAVYYAKGGRDRERLKWWNWMDTKK